jgi:GntR family transcriptional regulator
MDDFHTSQPIFVQIRQRLTEMILRGAVGEGDALPSVRTIAADLSVNPLTVTKAFEALVDVGVVEKRRGLGMFVKAWARAELLAHEREKFLKEDWPRIAAQIKALDLDLKTLIANTTDIKGPSHE